MRKIFSIILLCGIAVTLNAVPARRGWQTRTQADGTTIEIQQFGDEFYHYMINRDGKQVREVNGMYVEVGEAPTPAQAKARRAKGVARRQRKDVGTTPNLVPKGVVILANFSDKSMQSGHTQATFDELCNSLSCTVNAGYPSAGQYFADQSNGTYRPQFDVFGPVTLSRNLDYYGHNIDEYGNPTDESNDDTSDQYATDAVVEACILANQQFDINWADYDSDNDGYVDFVYVIYAGQGEADGGAANTIWPHNWEIESAIYYGNCTYTATQCRVDGKKLNNYAMSGELSGSSLGGIGTLCHEFGHVMGLPDLYDTSYGTNYKTCLTPNDWNIMDGGSYNGDGHCPPNYDPWEKEFFGWHTTVNLGNEGQNVTLYANGTQNYQAYQINASGSYVSPTTSGVRYYIENRQAVGWDAPLTGHGMLIWKVNFNATKWTNNEPNNTANNPYYTIISATGTKIGWDGSTDNCPKNTFPGSGNVTSYTGITGKPLLNIAESGQVVTLTYIEAPVGPVDTIEVNFEAFGRPYETIQCPGTLVLPENDPVACADGRVFVGWCKQQSYSSETTAPIFAKAGDAIEEGDTYYAVFADQDGEGAASVDATIVFANKGFENAQDVADIEMDNCTLTFSKGTNTQNGPKYYTSGEAVRCYKNNTLTVVSENTISRVEFSMVNGYAGAVQANVGTYNEGVWTGSANSVKFTNAPGDNSQWRIKTIKVTTGGGVSYSNYSTSCEHGTGIEHTCIKPNAQKVIRDGRMVILRGDAVYSVTGERLQ